MAEDIPDVYPSMVNPPNHVVQVVLMPPIETVRIVDAVEPVIVRGIPVAAPTLQL